MIDESKAMEIQEEHDRILNAAEDAGFRGSDAERATLLRLYADHGMEKMLAAIDSCVRHSAPNLAYLEACLKGEPKKKPTTRAVIAQAYAQRDYDEEQEKAMARMIAETEAANAV